MLEKMLQQKIKRNADKLLECRWSINGEMPATPTKTSATTTIPSNISWKIVWQCIQWKGEQHAMDVARAAAATSGSSNAKQSKIECAGRWSFWDGLLVQLILRSWRMINVKWNAWGSMLHVAPRRGQQRHATVCSCNLLKELLLVWST